MSSEGVSTGDGADLLFEVAPDGESFDAVRRVVVDHLREEHGDVFADDVREHVRVDSVRIDPSEWHVEGKLSTIRFDVDVSADHAATEGVLTYLRTRVDDRFGAYIDPDGVVFVEVSLRPSVWFVDAKVPPSPDDSEQ